MKRWLLVLGAVVAEVLGTMALRAAIDQPWWAVGVVAGYFLAFTLLGFALGEGMPIGVAYGIWAAAGVALVAILGAALFGETLRLPAIVGIVIIMVGVYLVQAGEKAPGREAVLES
ncbi:MAG: SMR family transporter [Yaniella sp.]|uniref:DMT family transporter n=1 Tax=Yaniella sp. TaxID=2773929 RepID=UPI00178FE715|nr:SMR family transporter [Yaniella sp.]NLZ97686.1 QacE family quaternary ammonium compound efflux SMR transporter [Micrococcus sp.]MDN5704816.1 SMR family transporter [Yaniella sp.]MDN5730841.1 SMR family transporter [Yaniella sp.]MDN5814720.1 SMR family transporter [Yaniella sp.]MDN5817256.1 SMR family transporter [Yaniella sp.]